MELQEQLKQEAIQLGACNDGIASWGEPTIDDLCLKYFKYQDFCIKHNWPTIDEIKAADQNIVRKYGIFVNGKEIAHSLKDIVVMGDAEVFVHVIEPCNVTVRHNGIAKIFVESDVLCYVDMYDNANVKVCYKEANARVAVSYYGGTIENKEMVDHIYNKEK